METHFHSGIEFVAEHLRRVHDPDSADRLVELDREFRSLSDEYQHQPRSAETEARMIAIFEETKLLLIKVMMAMTVKPIFDTANYQESASRA